MFIPLHGKHESPTRCPHLTLEKLLGQHVMTIRQQLKALQPTDMENRQVRSAPPTLGINHVVVGGCHKSRHNTKLCITPVTKIRLL